MTLQTVSKGSATTYTNGVVLTKFYSHIRPVKGGEYSEAESRKSDQNPHLEGGGEYSPSNSTFCIVFIGKRFTESGVGERVHHPGFPRKSVSIDVCRSTPADG